MQSVREYVHRKTEAEAWKPNPCELCPVPEPPLFVDGVAYRAFPPATDRSDGGVVMYSYGSLQHMDLAVGEDVQVARRCRALADHFSVPFVCWDPPGYGHTPGEPTEDAVCRAAAGVYDRLAESHKRVFVWGWSLGSVAACHLAAEREPAGVDLESPVATAMHVVFPHFPFHDVMGLVALNNVERCIASRGFKGVPLVVTTNAEDALVPPENGDWIARTAREAGNDRVERVVYPFQGHGRLADETEVRVHVNFFTPRKITEELAAAFQLS